MRREVTIEKDFTPIVRDASKINTLPEVEAPTVTRQSIQYSDWTVPAPLEARAVLLPPGGFGDPVRENLKRGYFDFGLGNYWNMAGNAGYRILQSEKDQLGVWWQHRSTCGTVDYNQQLPGYESSRTMRQLEERVVADYRHSFEKLDLGIRGGYRYDSFNYYGLRFPGVQGIASPGQEINRFFLKSRIASSTRTGSNAAGIRRGSPRKSRSRSCRAASSPLQRPSRRESSPAAHMPIATASPCPIVNPLSSSTAWPKV